MWIKTGYVAAFGLAAAVCFVSLRRARDIDDPDTSRGLLGLLLLSGTWAAATVGRLLAPGAGLEVSFYLLGLVVGLATVGAWLYFCSAYAGHDYHRRPVVRQLALVSYLVVVVVKLTNPVHGLYFTTAVASDPFGHLVIEFGPIYWIVTGLGYALSAVGFYILYDLFADAGFDTTTLGAVVGIAALPVVFDLVGLLAPGLVLKLNYEPLGVAVFAVGVLYFVEEKFVAVPTFGRTQIFDRIDDPIVLLDREGAIRDYNAATAERFPAVAGRRGEPLGAVAPELADLDSGEIASVGAGEATRHYLLERTPLSVGTSDIGRALVLRDVTAVERQRRELRRQNSQLDDFADAITHELRNTLGIVQDHLDLIEGRLPGTTDETVREPLETVDRTTDRMARIVGDLATLARYGQTLDSVERCGFRETVQSAWHQADTADLTLTIDGDGVLEADPVRFEELFQDAFAFACANGATRITVGLDADEITLSDDGVPLDPDDIEDAFSYGSPVPTAEAGMLLPNVRTLAKVHGWSVDVDHRYTDGVRLRVRGVTSHPPEDAPDRTGDA